MSKYNVLLTAPIYEEAINRIKTKADVHLVPKGIKEEEMIDLIKKINFDLFVVRVGKINSKVINSATNLKAIIKHGVGVDNIDIEEAKKQHIPVFYTPTANFESVAEHALALIMTLMKQVNRYDQELKVNKQWNQGKYQATELNGKTVGLIGLGRIGRRLTELLNPFRVKVLAYDPFLTKEPENIKLVQSLDRLLEEADVVSIHCPLTEQTEKLISTNELKKMKKSAYLINTARGAIIDQEALVKALESDEIAGAGLDTFPQEPLPADCPLFNLNNIIITPHIAGTALESYMRMGEQVADIALKVLENRISEIPNENYFHQIS